MDIIRLEYSYLIQKLLINIYTLFLLIIAPKACEDGREN